MEKAIVKAHNAGTVVFGICGGYQMLGELLSDPEGIEEGGEMRGIGLLPMKTVFADNKTRTRTEGTFENISGMLSGLSGMKLEGYEIHMGQSTPTKEMSGLTAITDNVTGTSKTEGAYYDNVYGSYVHGIFDGEGIAQAIVGAIAKEKGIELENLESFNYQEYKETQYDKMAAILREHLDVDKIYKILEEGV